MLKVKYILPILLVIFTLACNGDTFNKYKESRDVSDNPVIPDTEAPQIVSATATDKDKLVVVFNEEVTAETATDYRNYHIQGNNRINVLEAPAPELGENGTTVTLTLSTGLLYGMQNGREYTLLVQDVEDLVGNAILNDFAYFTGRGSVVAEIWCNGTQLPESAPYPAINTNNPEFNIVISGESGGYYSYSVDNGPWSGAIDVDEPIILSGLSEGYHTLKLIGQNETTGEWQDISQATVTEFLIDTIPPVAVLTHTPPNVTDSGDIAIVVEGDGVDTYRYRINASAWSGYINAGTAITETGLNDGTYTLYVRARDAAGNEQTVDTTITWKVSTTSPVAVLSNGPPRYTRLRIATFTVSGNDVYYYKYRINNDPWSEYLAVNQEITFENLADGDYTLYVVGASMPGDPDKEGEEVWYTWTVDNVVPECSISNLPANPTNSQKTYIVVSSTAGDVVSYRYRLITGGVQGALSGTYPVSMPIELTALPENTYTVKAIGIDAAGNTQSESNAAEWTWEVDITPPRATFTGTPDVSTSVNDLDVTVGPAGAVAYKSLLDSGQWSSETPVSVHITRANILDGYHTLSAVVRDAAGNWQSMQDPTEFVWLIDTVPPSVVLSNTPAIVTNAQTANIAVGGAGVVSYRYSLNGSAWSVEYSRIEYPYIELGQPVPLTDGPYTLEVLGVDLAGNWQTVATTFSWSINSTMPTAQLAGTPNAFTNVDSVNITVSGVEAYKYKLDNDAWTSETPVATFISISGISDGPHSILVLGKNALEQWQEVANATRFDWTVDTIPPMAELANKPSNPSSSQAAAIKVQGVGVYSYKASLDNPDPRGSSEVLLSSDDTINLDNLDAGTHTIYVIAKDEAGNWQDYTEATTYTWQIDTSTPTAEFVPGTLPANPTNSGTMAVNVGGTGVVSYKYKLDGASVWSGELDLSTQITRSGLMAGVHVVYAIAKNATGTWQSESSPTTYTWTIDFTAPSGSDIILGNLPDDPTDNDSINITVDGAGIVYYRYRINGESWSADIDVTTNIQRSGMADNIYTLYVIGRDTAGNWTPAASAKTYTWTIDSLSPIAAITNRPDDPTNSNSASFIIAGTGIIEYKYSLDGGAWSAWAGIAANINLSGLSDGSHIIEVCGSKDTFHPSSFDQEEVNATIYTWTVDTAAPTAALGNLPADPTSSTAINVTVAGTGVTAYRYRMDGGAWVPAASEIISEFPISLTGLAYSGHTLEVIGRDAAGNWQATATTYSWTINPPPLVSPETYDGADNTDNATITFSWVRPVGTADVKIQIASDSAFTSEIFQAAIGNVDSYDFIVTDTEIQRYFARVSVNSSSGMPVGDASWKAWGTASDGIYVTGGIVGAIYDAITRTGISGAAVEVRRMDNSQLIASGTTDTNGDFAFNNIPVGTNFYRITSSMTGYGSVGKNNITVALGSDTNSGVQYLVPDGASSGTITGRTLDANDAAYLSSTAVEVYDWQNSVVAETMTGAGGVFTTVSLSPGVYSVKFSRTGYYDLTVDNVVVNGNIDISNQAICQYLVEPQVRVIVLWGARPRDLDLHLVGPTSKTITSGDPNGGVPTNRFHVGYVGGYHYNYNEATGAYATSNPDVDGTSSTSSLVQDVYPGNPLTPDGGYGPEAINLWRYGGVQYARGIYTYTVRNYSGTDWYESGTNIILRIYDSQGMRREIIMPAGASDPGATTRDWKAVKITVQGNSRAKRLIYVPSQSVFFNAGSDNSKAGFDW